MVRLWNCEAVRALWEDIFAKRRVVQVIVDRILQRPPCQSVDPFHSLITLIHASRRFRVICDRHPVYITSASRWSSKLCSSTSAGESNRIWLNHCSPSWSCHNVAATPTFQLSNTWVRWIKLTCLLWHCQPDSDSDVYRKIISHGHPFIYVKAKNCKVLK